MGAKPVSEIGPHKCAVGDKAFSGAGLVSVLSITWKVYVLVIFEKT